METLKKGDTVKLKHDIHQDQGKDKEYSCSFDSGEIGEIKSISNENTEFESYLVKFPDDVIKQGSKSAGRFIYLTKAALQKV